MPSASILSLPTSKSVLNFALQQNHGAPDSETIPVSGVSLGSNLELDQAHVFTPTTSCCAAQFAGTRLRQPR